MARVLSRNQEAFANAYIRLGSGLAAYREAYPPTKGSYRGEKRNVAFIMGNERVQKRIAELRAPVAEKTQETLETICAQLDEARDLARQWMKPEAMVKAVMGKAQVLGFLVERKDVNIRITGDEARHGIVQLAARLLEQQPKLLEHEP